MAIYDVTTYGAVGNGTTDDTAAFNSAVALINAGSGGDTLKIPSTTGIGTYLVDYITPITASNTTILMDGFAWPTSAYNAVLAARAQVFANTTQSFQPQWVLLQAAIATFQAALATALTVTHSIVLKKINGTNLAVFTLSGSDCIVEGGEINGQGLSQSWWTGSPYTNTSPAYNVYFDGGSGNTVQNCYSHQSSAAAVNFQNSTDATILNVASDNNGAMAFWIGNGCTSSIINQCYVNNNYSDCCNMGYTGTPSNSCTVENCLLMNARVIEAAPDQFAGCYWENCTSGTSSGNIMTGNSNRGDDLDADTCIGVVCLNNIYADNLTDGCMLGESGCTIDGCVIFDNGSSNTSHGGIGCRGSGHLIENCIIRAVSNIQGYGLYNFGSTVTNLTVNNNDLRANTSSPIDSYTAASSGFSQSGNTTTLANDPTKTNYFVYASLQGDTLTEDLASYQGRVGDKNWQIASAVETGTNYPTCESIGTAYAFAANNSNGNCLYLFNTPASTELVQLQYNVLAGSSGIVINSLFGAYVDGNNNFQANYRQDTTTLTFFNTVAGVSTTTSVSVTPSGYNTVEIITKAGSLVDVYWNGTKVLSNCSYAGNTVSGNKVGVLCLGAGNANITNTAINFVSGQVFGGLVAGVLSYTGTPAVNDVVLDWTAASGGSGSGYTYNLYRSANSGMTSPVTVASGLTSLTHTDTSVSSGTWYYQIEAIDSADNTAVSNVLQVVISATNATGYTLTGPSSPIVEGVQITLTLTLTGGTTLSSSLLATLALGNGLSGTFASGTLTISGGDVATMTNGTTTGTVLFTPSATVTNGTITPTHTGGGFSGDPSALTYTVTQGAATAWEISAPSTGTSGSPISILLTPNGLYTGTPTVSDNSAGGTFGTVPSWSNSSESQAVIYTSPSDYSGVITFTVSSSGLTPANGSTDFTPFSPPVTYIRSSMTTPTIFLKASEQRPIYGTLSMPVGGTVTFVSCTWSLFLGGQPIVTGQAISGNTGSGSQTITVYVNFNPSAYAMGVNNAYQLVFLLQATGSDGVTRIVDLPVTVEIVPDYSFP
jgi:hypothetical protein